MSVSVQSVAVRGCCGRPAAECSCGHPTAVATPRWVERKAAELKLGGAPHYNAPAANALEVLDLPPARRACDPVLVVSSCPARFNFYSRCGSPGHFLVFERKGGPDEQSQGVCGCPGRTDGPRPAGRRGGTGEGGRPAARRLGRRGGRRQQRDG